MCGGRIGILRYLVVLVLLTETGLLLVVLQNIRRGGSFSEGTIRTDDGVFPYLSIKSILLLSDVSD